MQSTQSSTPKFRIVPGMKKGRHVVLQAPSSDDARAYALRFWPAWGGYHPHTFCSSRKGAERVIAEVAA